jgi:hypothetical protein
MSRHGLPEVAGRQRDHLFHRNTVDRLLVDAFQLYAIRLEARIDCTSSLRTRLNSQMKVLSLAVELGTISFSAYMFPIRGHQVPFANEYRSGVMLR